MTTEKMIEEAIAELERAYVAYMSRLKAVLDFGDANIGSLIAALDHKQASPVAKAIGLMMHRPAATEAIPRLLDWLVAQTPLYPDVLEALVRAGDVSAGQVLPAIRASADNSDDEAVRHLFDLACRYSDAVIPKVVTLAIELLNHPNPHVREAATDAIWKIGLPHGSAARALLHSLSQDDSSAHVRTAAIEALQKLGDEVLPLP